MNNYSKMTLVVFSALSLMFLASFASAYQPYTYRDVSETISYNEDLAGENRGFSLMHKSSMPRTNPLVGCDYYDWTSDFRKCRHTAYYNGYSEDYYGYSNNDDSRAYYDQDKALKEAFKTYQQSSKQQFQLESQRINMAQRRYSYGGYGYGYSGARYYRYGW